MAVLRRLGAIAVQLAVVVDGYACYTPAVRDCTVSCASPDDCTGGQVCGPDGMCAAPEVAGRCQAATADAGTVRDAAPPRDAAPRIDAAPPTVALRVQIVGKGEVIVEGVGTCSSRDPQDGDCTYQVAPGIERTARARPIDNDRPFAAWISLTCAGQDASCGFTPAGPTTLTALFGRADGLR